METGRKELEAIREWIDAQTGEFILTVLFGKGEENDRGNVSVRGGLNSYDTGCSDSVGA
jgi:hypothetical protein